MLLSAAVRVSLNQYNYKLEFLYSYFQGNKINFQMYGIEKRPASEEEK